jgi:hypothetical protein
VDAGRSGGEDHDQRCDGEHGGADRGADAVHLVSPPRRLLQMRNVTERPAATAQSSSPDPPTRSCVVVLISAAVLRFIVVSLVGGIDWHVELMNTPCAAIWTDSVPWPTRRLCASEHSDTARDATVAALLVGHSDEGRFGVTSPAVGGHTFRT